MVFFLKEDIYIYIAQPTYRDIGYQGPAEPEACMRKCAIFVPSVPTW